MSTIEMVSVTPDEREFIRKSMAAFRERAPFFAGATMRAQHDADNAKFQKELQGYGNGKQLRERICMALIFSPCSAHDVVEHAMAIEAYIIGTEKP